MNEAAKRLFEDQLADWPLVKKNYAALEQIQVKRFVITGNTIKVQFNPARIVSTAAKTDTESIRKRACFLCPENRPAEQEGITIQNKYTLLINPFPIFPRHLTIPTVTHTPQRFDGRFFDFLELAKKLDEYVLFYNGPHCGASAPDHMHFQAGIKGFLPIESEWKEKRSPVCSTKQGAIWKINDNLRTGWILEGNDPNGLRSLFNALFCELTVFPGEQEPRINLLAWYENWEWFIVLFPRRKHRPDCYFVEGEKQRTVSPASVDLGGVFIVPREVDFERITSDEIDEILREVCLSKWEEERISNRIIQQV